MKLIRELMEVKASMPSTEEIREYLTSEPNAYNLDFEADDDEDLDIAALHSDPKIQKRLRGNRPPPKFGLIAYNETCTSKLQIWVDGTVLHAKGGAVVQSDSDDNEHVPLELEVDMAGREESAVADSFCEQLDEFFAGLEHDDDDDDAEEY